MIGNKSNKETRKISHDLNPLVITLIFSLLLMIPQVGLGLILKVR